MLLICCMSITVFADDRSATGSITVTMEYNNKSVSGGNLTIYKVGDAQKAGTGYQYTLTEDFAGSGAVLATEESADTAKTLSTYASNHGITGTTLTIDSSGKASFEDLAIGVYLIVQNKAASGYAKISPFLVNIPLVLNTGVTYAVSSGNEIYDVDAFPKMTKRSSGSSSGSSSYTSITTVTNPTTAPGITSTTTTTSTPGSTAAPGSTAKPGTTGTPGSTSTTDGTPGSTGTPGTTGTPGSTGTTGTPGSDGTTDTTGTPGSSSDPNSPDAPNTEDNTSSTDGSEPGGSQRTADGSTPSGSSTSQDGTTPSGGSGQQDVVITPSETKTAETPKLPQTGQLNWPIPVLVVLGLAAFSIGWNLRFGRIRRR
jgi:hypothetical protein